MTATFEWSQTYLEDQWQPVRLELRNDTQRALAGSVQLPLVHSGAPAVMKVPVNVPPNSWVRTTVWGYFVPAQVSEKQRSRGATPPLTNAEWRGDDGGLLARAELMGIAISQAGAAEGEGAAGDMVLLVRPSSIDLEPADDPYDMLAHLHQEGHGRTTVASVEPAGLTPHGPSLRPLKAIVLDQADPESFDVSQRRALLEYLHAGGIVVLSAPDEVMWRAGTWLQSLLPVRMIGIRQAKQIKTNIDDVVLKLRDAVAIVEAVEGDGQVLLRDRDYVHVAVKQIGLGKVVFTSFPINALDHAQPQVAMLWEQLLSLHAPQREVAATRLGEIRAGVVGSMIGTKIASWALAGALAGSYLLIILIAQGLFLGPSRPKAVIISAAAALLLSGAVLAMGFSRRGEQSLQSARLAVLDVAAGGGTMQESAALIGADAPGMTLASRDEATTIRPAMASGDDRPTIRQQPFAVENAGVYAHRIERIWEAAGPADAKLRLDAVARFDAGGVALDVNNDLGQAIEAPLVISQLRALAMSDLPAGRSTVADLRLNARDDFSGRSVLTSDQANRRAQIVKASLVPLEEQPGAKRRAQPPMLIGWIADAGGALIRPSGEERVEAKSMIMVRTPLRIESPQIASKISVPAPFVEIDTGRLLYEAARGETAPSQEVGHWLVKFSPLPQLGQLRPGKATLEMRVNLPAHTFTVRKGQAAGGKPKVNLAGESVAEWSRDVGLKTVSIDCTPADVDRDGGVWLLFEIAQAGTPTAGAPVSWQMKDLSMAIEGEVVAPPRPIVLEPPLRALTAQE